MHFSELKLNERLLAAVAAEGYTTPTVIQQKAIPEVLAGRDLVGLAQTGTGKTAAFALPLLHNFALRPARGPRRIRALVLAPTRELAAQIEQSFATYGQGSGLRQTVIFGGVGQDKQTRALRAGVDILVATPGRLLDLHGQGLVDLKGLEVFVLDEADRMLDMGFIHDVRRVVQLLPRERQTLFFSATMPPEVKKLADGLLRNPVQVEAHPVSSTAERIEQSVYFVATAHKRSLLQHLLGDASISRALVFTRTKHGANRVAEFLSKAQIGAQAIHGNKSQSARERALSSFISGETRVLVATDIAARGIDVDAVSHVINFDLPNVPESYVHRIGRTARAGASGIALSFCDSEERPYLADIERLIGKAVPRVEDHPFRGAGAAAAVPEEAPRPRPPPRQGDRHRGARGGASPGRSGRGTSRQGSSRQRPASSGGGSSGGGTSGSARGLPPPAPGRPRTASFGRSGRRSRSGPSSW